MIHKYLNTMILVWMSLLIHCQKLWKSLLPVSNRVHANAEATNSRLDHHTYLQQKPVYSKSFVFCVFYFHSGLWLNYGDMLKSFKQPLLERGCPLQQVAFCIFFNLSQEITQRLCCKGDEQLTNAVLKSEGQVIFLRFSG